MSRRFFVRRSAASDRVAVTPFGWLVIFDLFERFRFMAAAFLDVFAFQDSFRRFSNRLDVFAAREPPFFRASPFSHVV